MSARTTAWVVVALGLAACSTGPRTPDDSSSAADGGGATSSYDASTSPSPTNNDEGSTGDFEFGTTVIPGDDPTVTLTGTGTGTGTETGGGVPTIVSLSVNAGTIGPGDTLEVSAIVTDPDGIDDLIGGQLVVGDGLTLGTFQTAAQEGAYGISLTFTDLLAVSGLQTSSTTDLVLTAEFFDQSGSSSSESVGVGLSCTDYGVLCDACINECHPVLAPCPGGFVCGYHSDPETLECEPAGAALEGEACIFSADCAQSICASQVCRRPCLADADCSDGLGCSLISGSNTGCGELGVCI